MPAKCPQTEINSRSLSAESLRHLYIHIPFCSGKCTYCGFYSEPYERKLANRFLSSLATDIQRTLAAAPRCTPHTIYIGGGTPSILPAAQLRQLLSTVERHIEPTEIREWTVEANPGTLDRGKLDLLRRAGVTRISLGAQSLDDTVLRQLGRRHDVAAVADSVKVIREAGIPQLSLDLIAALPGVTPRPWHAALRDCIRLEPDHLSVYCLTLEDGTPLARAVRKGTFRPPTEDEELRALRSAESILRKAGYRRYEISNYARPDCACLHNLAFWRGEDYLGVGPAASSRSDRFRWTNKPDLFGYITAIDKARPPPCDIETLDDARDTAERLAFAFRLTEGVDLSDFLRHPSQPDSATATELHRRLRRLRAAGLLRLRHNRWIPTRHGLDLADTIAAHILT